MTSEIARVSTIVQLRAPNAIYSNSLGANNPGDFLEQQVAPPGASINTFANNAK
jgi:hypothetical protein